VMKERRNFLFADFTTSQIRFETHLIANAA
jgi:hypothetical protein